MNDLEQKIAELEAIIRIQQETIEAHNIALAMIQKILIGS